MLNIFILAFSGSLGVLFRYFIGVFFSRYIGFAFPASTLVINIIGSLLIGVVYVLAAEKNQLSYELNLALSVGFLGGFTTFSTYSLDVLKLLETNQTISALSYFVASPILGLAMVFIGVFGTRALLN